MNNVGSNTGAGAVYGPQGPEGSPKIDGISIRAIQSEASAPSNFMEVKFQELNISSIQAAQHQQNNSNP